ncbi:uncharacterized protein [Diabrotica undecimpunctata]|uniref:uncharacterized protein n=1 Tax=Diabrotica undecimpunctata TaxID=50387 RepID=UPI003B63DF63
MSFGEQLEALYSAVREMKLYDTVLGELENYFTPKKNVIYERFLFYNRKQEEGELFDTDLTDLRKLAKNCEFGDVLDSMIRDRLVLGTINKDLQEKMLQNHELTLQKFKEVQSSQTLNVYSVKGGNGNQTARGKASNNNFNTGRSKRWEQEENSRKSGQCRKCGRDHEFRRCPAFGKMCNKCLYYNHFAKMCNNRIIREVQEIQEVYMDSKEEEFMVTSIEGQSHSSGFFAAEDVKVAS